MRNPRVSEIQRFGPYAFKISNRDKVLFPDSGVTKGDLIDYYRRIGETMLPHLRGRPLTLHRFPDGIGEEGFYQKEISDYFPDWIDRVTVPKEGGKVTHVLCENVATLAYLANQACITPHIWLSRQDRPRHPDRLVFDLDPPADDFEPVRTSARILARLLDELGLPVFLQTTGSRGIHVVVPLDRSEPFGPVRSFARDLANLLARRHPDRLTVEARKAKRGERVYLDVLRNGYAQTMVAPYSVRARPGAPVATPIEPEELENPDLGSRTYTVQNVFRRLGQKQDPWRGIGRRGRSLTRARERLGRLLAEERTSDD